MGKITTRCPSCHFQTLSINEQGQLFCTWIECEEPAMIHTIGEIEHAKSIINQIWSREEFPTQEKWESYFRDKFNYNSQKVSTEDIKP